jgi:hypothetical protein
MNESNSESIQPIVPNKGKQQMTEMLVIGGFVAVWFLLQMWLLPRFGVQT